jgi:plasmid stability protein
MLKSRAAKAKRKSPARSTTKRGVKPRPESAVGKSVTIRGLDPAVIAQIKAHAKENGRSMEEEIRFTLRERYTHLARARRALARMQETSERLGREGRGLNVPPEVLKSWINEGRP